MQPWTTGPISVQTAMHKDVCRNHFSIQPYKSDFLNWSTIATKIFPDASKYCLCPLWGKTWLPKEGYLYAWHDFQKGFKQIMNRRLLDAIGTYNSYWISSLIKSARSGIVVFNIIIIKRNTKNRVEGKVT